jgi:hypothetical protein
MKLPSSGSPENESLKNPAGFLARRFKSSDETALTGFSPGAMEG